MTEVAPYSVTAHVSTAGNGTLAASCGMPVAQRNAPSDADRRLRATFFSERILAVRTR
jgi:hypothetical protein